MTPSGRERYLALARAGIRMPIGTDLVLREKPDHEAILLDGVRLGRVFEESARRWKTPLAIPLMDLALEKDHLLGLMGIPEAARATHHFTGIPGAGMTEAFERGLPGALSPRMAAHNDAIRWVAANTGLVPGGMTIGPFSLTTKLLEDVIPAVYLAGSGETAADAEEVAALEAVRMIALKVVMRSVEAQLDAGAQVIMIAEPAGSAAYLSPNQVEADPGLFDRFVVSANRQVTGLIESRGAQVFFHCCGELCPAMVKAYGSLRPALLSLGSSRVLWEDESLIPKDTVMYGNLPTKKFLNETPTEADVRAMARDLMARMKATGHPFILGSECDVLSVKGREALIKSKVEAFLSEPA